jgi:hypothetical protein
LRAATSPGLEFGETRQASPETGRAPRASGDLGFRTVSAGTKSAPLSFAIPRIISSRYFHRRGAQGAVAQLGEHLLCKQGVAGSIPVRSIPPNSTSSNHFRTTWAQAICGESGFIAHLLPMDLDPVTPAT